MTVLVVDTSAWRGRGDAWFEGQRDRGRGLAIADQGARELVRQAIEEPAEFSQARAACRRAARFTTVRLPPIELHLLTALGVVQTLPDPPDPRRLCALVARSASHRDLLYNVSRDIPIGSGMSFSAAASLKSMREEKLEWLRDWEELLEQIAPGSMRPKSTRPPLKIEAMEYAKRRAALRRDRIGLVQLESRRAYNWLQGSVEFLWNDIDVLLRLEPMLATYCAVHAEALLDRFTGPHNARGPSPDRWEVNDWYDVAQLRYVQGDWKWVTSDRIWVELARRAGHRDRVALPEELAD